ncbi:ATP-grasp fold amidoligase family protein [Sphingomonas astaxanthinifaciens]|uniref:Glycosyl transferase n=1 Tax=Sphingomonas astaxanthinifaciens DSM 22298 TaxID=1123267 RepID=A0ABQ5Z5R1_9SPHN|nr:ATP-grasp fold amidoligase family protein [Sphingomonas astaxanthinifaciens]GLR46871.1 glycosyl transferase [Sphingomonas astaxanthinifaciens DSM 22298]
MRFLYRPPTPPGTSRLRIQLTYLWRHRRLARLAAPVLLTEWIQHRKLHDRDPRLPLLADKVKVKPWVAQQLGLSWVTPTLWQGSRLPEHPAWDFPYVVKSRHGCNQTLVVRNAADHREARDRSAAWMAHPYGGWLDEWLYGGIERGLLVEPFIGEGDALPLDYKIFVFGGEARFVQVHLGRGTNHRWIVFDRQWKRVSPASADPDPARPASLAAMLRAAERLGAGFDFVRADFYEIAGTPRFGELTFYPGSGLEAVEPPSLDALMGALWAGARAGGEDQLAA